MAYGQSFGLGWAETRFRINYQFSCCKITIGSTIDIEPYEYS